MTKWNHDARVRPKRSTFDVEGKLVLSEPIGDEFDDVLDPLNDLLTGRNKSLPASRHEDPIQGVREEHEAKRNLALFERNLKEVVGDMVAPQLIVITSVTRDNSGCFIIHAMNRSTTSRFAAYLHADKLETIMAHTNRDDFRAVCDHVARELVTARNLAAS